MRTSFRLAIRLFPSILAGIAAIGCGGDDGASKDDETVEAGAGDSDAESDESDSDAAASEGAGSSDDASKGEPDAGRASDAASGSDAGDAGASDVKQLELDWRTQVILGATNMCTACTNKLGYASFSACLADNNGTDLPKEGEDRGCQLAAYALDATGSKAFLSCWLPVERAWAVCVGTGFTCSSAQYQGCLDPYVAKAKACPDLSAQVKMALSKCPKATP